METHAGALCAAMDKPAAANTNAAAVLASTSVWELNLQRPLERSIEDLISPHWAGISTLAIAPGCCGFIGPVPSATLDKRWWLASERILPNALFQSRTSLNFSSFKRHSMAGADLRRSARHRLHPSYRPAGRRLDPPISIAKPASIVPKLSYRTG